jgi:hypothetical protein
MTSSSRAALEASIASHLSQGAVRKALMVADEWAQTSPREAAPHAAVARVALTGGYITRAIEAADQALQCTPSDPHMLLLRAVCDHRLGRTDDAVARLRALLRRTPPNQVEAAVALAETLHRSGRFTELAEHLARGGAWLADPRAPLFAARVEAAKDSVQGALLLERILKNSSQPVVRRVAGFEAVKLLDAAGRFQHALELARLVHRLTTPAFDLASIEAEVEASFANLADSSDAASREHSIARGPVVDGTAFVVGLPRSGTTLLEQMLDRHPLVSGIGEYEGAFAMREALVGLGVWPTNVRGLRVEDAARLSAEYLEGAHARRREGASWTFDKSLYQWRLLPVLAAVLPGAAYIHIERDARDCAISMHLSNFHPKSWGFTADMAQIRRVIELERRVVRRMCEGLGLRAVHVRYEDLVDHPEREMRRVLEMLGLPFDPVVLAPEENRRTVLTLSFEQVRRKINRSSIGRWKNYEFAFGREWDALTAERRESSVQSSD